MIPKTPFRSMNPKVIIRTTFNLILFSLRPTGNLINLVDVVGTFSLTSPNYPSCNFSDNFRRTWLIEADVDMNILVEVVYFQGENTDTIAIGNGEDSASTSTVIARLTKKSKTATITSRGSKMWVELNTGTSSYHVAYRGFHFQVSQISNITGKWKQLYH